MKLVYAKTTEGYQLNTNINTEDLVFIEDSQLIITHGVSFGGKLYEIMSEEAIDEMFKNKDLYSDKLLDTINNEII